MIIFITVKIEINRMMQRHKREFFEASCQKKKKKMIYIQRKILIKRKSGTIIFRILLTLILLSIKNQAQISLPSFSKVCRLATLIASALF